MTTKQEITYTYKLDEEARKNLLMFLYKSSTDGVPQSDLLLKMYAYFQNQPSHQTKKVNKVVSKNKKRKKAR